WSPNHEVRGADVQLDGPAMLLHGTPDSSGVARFPSLTPGYYKVRVRAIGYVTYLQEFTIDAGCATWIEVYLTINPCDIGACAPLARPRATVTTCAPGTPTRPPPSR
ncbi:MAG: carboxypeptidase-like regulatory domain-containing protein, partial [Gemmatimonadales bacterium]